jgi:hypothetical protein
MDMKAINTMAAKLFDLYYIDIDRNTELSSMMRTMTPPYYVDPTNPEHPSCYILAGRSSVPYLERIMYVTPFVDEKGKYQYDLSGWRGLLINPVEVADKLKEFHKTKLEPLVIMGERNGDLYNQSLILREDKTAAKDELVIPFLQLPNRKRDGEDAYMQALQSLIYDPSYQYLVGYMNRGLKFRQIESEIIQDMLDNDITEFVTLDGDRVAVTKHLFPGLKSNDQIFSIAKVDQPDIDTSGGRFHYVISQEVLKNGTTYVTIYTLLAALQMV